MSTPNDLAPLAVRFDPEGETVTLHRGATAQATRVAGLAPTPEDEPYVRILPADPWVIAFDGLSMADIQAIHEETGRLLR